MTVNILPIIPKEYAVLPRMTLHVCATDRFKIGYISIRALLPNNDPMLPLASLLFPVLRRGTVSYPTQEKMNRHLDDMYATDCRVVHGTVGNLRSVGFAADVPESRVLAEGVSLLPDVIALMSELFFAPVTDDDGRLLERYVTSEKGRLIDAVTSLVNHPASYAFSHFQRAFADGRDTVMPLDVKQLERVDVGGLHELMQYLRRQAHFQVFYVGQTDSNTIIAALQRCFASALVPSSSSFACACVRPLVARPTVHRVTEELAVGQSHLLLGYRTDITLLTHDFFAMMVCNEMLGGSPISRLFVYLREGRGLCYSCHSEYLIDRGEMILSCGIDRNSREEAERAMQEQVEAICRGEFSEAELQAAKKLLIADYTQLEDSTHAVASFYRLRHAIGMTQTVSDCKKAFLSVTAEQVMRAAETLRLDTIYFLCGTAATAEEESLVEKENAEDEEMPDE